MSEDEQFDWDGEEETLLDKEPECEETSDLVIENIIKEIYNFKKDIYTAFRNKVHENNINNDVVNNRDLILLYKYICNYIINSIKNNNMTDITDNDILNEELKENLYELINKIRTIDSDIFDCYITSIFIKYPYSLNKQSLIK